MGPIEGWFYFDFMLEDWSGVDSFSKFLYFHWKCMFGFWFVVVGIVLLIATAIMTYQERVSMGELQMRKGPKKTGLGGLLQAISDAFKLISKEYVTGATIHDNLFFFTSTISFTISLFFWYVVPFASEIVINNSDYSFIYLFALGSFHAYTILIAGWASATKYSFLGAIRTCAQLLAYEVGINLIFVEFSNYVKLINANVYCDVQLKTQALFLYATLYVVAFFILSLAEGNRHPFDLPEAEAELVAGYNVDYSSIRFAMFFLSEYLGLIFYALLFDSLFFSGFCTSIITWTIKMLIIIYLFIFIRAAIPRYRYDQLMLISWKIFIPILAVLYIQAVLINFFV